MTVSSDTNKISYAGDGSVTVFSTSFSFAANTEVSLTLVTDSTGAESAWVEGTQYTLTGAASGGAGTVTVASAPTDYTPQTGYSLIIDLKPAFTQTRALPRNGTISPKDIIEPALDKSTRQILRLKDSVDRSIKAPLAEASIGDIPQKSLRKGYLLGFDPTSGDPVVSNQTLATIEAGSTNAAASAAAAALSALAAAADKTAADADVVSTNADVVSAGNSATAAAGSAVSAAASAAGIYWKEPCLVRSTGNLTLSGEQTIDGVVTLTSRVLTMDQTAAAENGVYVTAAGAWARAAPMDTWAEFVGAVVIVSQGTANADTAWICTVDAGGTLGTTAITWINFATGGLLAANNLSDLANAATARGNLGVAVGTNVQAFDAQLADIAGLTYAQGDILYYNGTNVVNLGPGTSGQALITGGAAADPAWGTVGGKVTPARATSAVDTALATQALGGTQIFDFGAMTIPATGVIRFICNRLEFDETAALNANAGFALKIGTDALIWATGDAGGGSFEYHPYIFATASTTSILVNGGTGGFSSAPLSFTFDIGANGMSTGSQNVSVYLGDNVNGNTGKITITGTTYLATASVEIKDET